MERKRNNPVSGKLTNKEPSLKSEGKSTLYNKPDEKTVRTPFSREQEDRIREIFQELNHSADNYQSNYPENPAPKIGWLGTEKDLEILYTAFRNAGKINCEIQLFINRFLIGDAKKQVPWLGLRIELIQSISGLIEKKKIPPRTDYIIMVCQNFCKSDGSQYNPASLKTMKGRKTKNDFARTFVDLFVRRTYQSESN